MNGSERYNKDLGKQDIPHWKYDQDKAMVLDAVENNPAIRELVLETLRRRPRKTQTVENRIANVVQGTVDHKADYLVRFNGDRVTVQEVKFSTSMDRNEDSMVQTSTLKDIYGDDIR